MPFIVSLADAQALHPEFRFIAPLTPSAQKAAFHVRDNLQRDLCLKIIAPDYDLDRLKREIEALQRVTHPNVGRFVEYLYSSKAGDHRHYFVEEFVDGLDLSVDLQDGSAWRLEKIRAIFTALANGLEALRKAEIVHRDLKPSNIRIRPSGEPVIIDFGLARHLGMPDLTRTSDGAQMGTPSYFAPEQWRGTKYDIDHRTDLFAFGILLHQALTGGHPFWTSDLKRAELEKATCESDDFQRVGSFATLPEEWKRLTARLLNKSRAQRPHRAEQVVQLLSEMPI